MKKATNYEWTYAFSLSPHEKLIKQVNLGSGITKITIKNLNYNLHSEKEVPYRSEYYLDGEKITSYRAHTILAANKDIHLPTLGQDPLPIAPTLGQDSLSIKQEKFTKQTAVPKEEITKETPYKMQDISFLAYKITLGFQFVDSVIVITKLIKKPTLENLKDTAFTISNLYSMYYGINTYSLGLTLVESLYQCYKNEYTQAAKQFSTSISYALLPNVLENINFPLLNLLHSVAIATYTGYNTINDAYSLYQQYNNPDTKSNSLENYYCDSTNNPDLCSFINGNDNSIIE